MRFYECQEKEVHVRKWRDCVFGFDDRNKNKQMIRKCCNTYRFVYVWLL